MAFSAVANDIPERLTEPRGEHVYLPDPDKVFEDSAATTPASVGGPVGAWEDQSGNHTATQSTTANKPTLRQDANGQFYVEFVPNEDFLETGVSTTNATKASSIPGVGAFSAQTKPGNKSRTNARIQSTTAGAVVKMKFMFAGSPVTDLSPLSGWDVSNVTNMGRMFEACANLSDISPLSGWNTGSVTNMQRLFRNTNVTDPSPISGWDVANVTDFKLFLSGPPLDSVKTGDMLDGWTDSSNSHNNTASDMKTTVTLGIQNADYNNMNVGGQTAVDDLCCSSAGCTSNGNTGPDWTINATNAPSNC